MVVWCICVDVGLIMMDERSQPCIGKDKQHHDIKVFLGIGGSSIDFFAHWHDMRTGELGWWKLIVLSGVVDNVIVLGVIHLGIRGQGEDTITADWGGGLSSWREDACWPAMEG